MYCYFQNFLEAKAAEASEIAGEEVEKCANQMSTISKDAISLMSQFHIYKPPQTQISLLPLLQEISEWFELVSLATSLHANGFQKFSKYRINHINRKYLNYYASFFVCPVTVSYESQMNHRANPPQFLSKATKDLIGGRKQRKCPKIHDPNITKIRSHRVEKNPREP